MTTTKKRPAPWSPEENAAVVALYFAMLNSATTGKPYNKAAMIRKAQGTRPKDRDCRAAFCDYANTLANRSKQSIEFKLMNASAAHADIINDYIESFGEPTNRETMHGHGYRAMPNYQASLKDAMHRALERRARGADGPALADAG